jgi:predicted PurR-regulated permease PerM
LPRSPGAASRCAAPGGSPGKAEPTQSSAKPPPDSPDAIRVRRRAGGDRATEPGTVRSRVGGWPIAAALAVIALILYLIRYALLPFVFAIAIAFVTDPLIRGGQHRLRLPRWVVGALIYAVLILLFAATLYAIGANAVHDFVQMAERGPATLRKFIEDVLGPNGIALFGKIYRVDDVMQALSAAAEKLVAAGAIVKLGSFGVGALFGLFLTLVLTPYFMISGPRLAAGAIAAGAIWLIPPERRKSVTDLLPKIVPALRRYLLGIFLVVVYTSVIAWIGFGPIFALPGAVLLAVTVGILEIMPVVGPISAALLVGIVATQQTTLTAAALLMGFVLALRLSIDNIIGPIVLGQAARLHPVVVIAGFVCGAMLFGVVGLLLAVPTAVCIKIALEHYYAEPIRPGEREG